MLRVALPTFRSTRLLEFHSGPITGLDSHPREHVVATAGEDATVSGISQQFSSSSVIRGQVLRQGAAILCVSQPRRVGSRGVW